MLGELQIFVPSLALLTIRKCFIGPHLDHGDSLYDQENNLSVYQQLESTYFNAALALIRVIRGS